MEILKYKNGINNLDFGGMTPKEQDIFFALLKNSKEKGEINISFSIVKNLINTPDETNKRFLNRIDKLSRKLLQATQKIELENGIDVYFNVLDDITIDKKNSLLITSIKSKFLPFLKFDEKEGGYTAIDLEEMSNFSSGHSKILYRYIKQWETVGIITIEIEDFKKMLDISKAYRFYDIDRAVLAPILKELSDIFIGLNIEKNKSKTKGRKIESLTFSWQRVERKKKADKFKKKTIEETAVRKKSSHGEEEFKKYEADKRLADTIETNLDSKVITNENSNAKIISLAEYDAMYKEYLEENGIVHSKFVKLAFERSIASKYKIAN